MNKLLECPPPNDGKFKRFVSIPHVILESYAVRTLSHIEFRILIHIASLYNGTNNGKIAVAQETLEHRFGVSPKTVGNSFRSLVKRGLLRRQKVYPKEKRMATEYSLSWLPNDVEKTEATNSWQRYNYTNMSEKDRKILSGVRRVRSKIKKCT